ncbi:MAG: PEP-CTERM sorting domain-containing protein [Fimbriimonadaceae bacterium]|nr:PEP-CTERM sorting domain-containing protein [Chthonomonadaceae bacterium]MCO5295829.1 PEP-CTERM sorting domain-containing protein [Fimbriimonadaceae bacterium]
MNHSIKLLAAGAVFTIASAGAHATWFTDEASFLAAIDGTYYLENFDGWSFGNPLGGDLTWSAPGGNGYGWDAAASNGLYSLPGGLSTNSPEDPIDFTFTGAPVTAFGMNLSDTDFDGNFIPGDVTLDLSNGQSNTLTVGANETFVGWVGNDVLTSASIVAVSAADDYVLADHVYTGAAPVPEPASMVALALGAGALLRRRAKKA